MRNRENICITYLDESRLVDFNTKEEYYTIASITALREKYINEIEVKWAELRKEYNVPDGLNIHFTDVKYLLQINPRKPYKPEWINIFKEKNTDNVDRLKVYHFFKDIINTLEEMEFFIHITGINVNKEHIIRKQGAWLKNRSYQPPYIAFKEHLDLMVPYLIKLKEQNQVGIENKNKWYSTKLRYDGDVGLGERQDLKEAYHHAITIGTKHFRPEIINELYDEIRFVGKEEVSTGKEVTHAGSEIIDFIATIVSRNLWKREMERTKITLENQESLEPLDVIGLKIVREQKINDINY
ncbi:DUF3800 domain-containing protein [Heliorestis acidaminivorans]|uniref:DUF3800 domain-containing protein n=1 Tax=Heliorestis acidaminivorans TaxID=553427 RepID=A0A6I0EU34_9FIRM|nr:hypothetical protein [Heliorestis acidaminivorans]KAB2953704.1 DUF3800 domain-containing protein [Heliorestis acidaminivorans]